MAIDERVRHSLFHQINLYHEINFEPEVLREK